MKNTFLPFFLAGIFLFALAKCQNNQTTPPQASLPAESKLEGFWVNRTWWQTLTSTRSAKQASGNADISSAAITLDSSKWMANLSYNWHEGSQYLVKPAGDKFILIVDYPDSDKAHELSLQPDGSLQIDSTSLVRIGDGRTGYQIISATVLGGIYTRNGQPGPVEFKADGTVTGLDNYKRYEVMTDYMMDDLGVDQLTLDKGDDSPVFFAFEQKGDNLKIYTIEEKAPQNEGDYPQYKLGKVQYDLSRSK